MAYSPKRPGGTGIFSNVSPMNLVLIIAVSLVIIILIISSALSNDFSKSASANYYFNQVRDYVMVNKQHADHHAAHPTVAARLVDDGDHVNEQHPGEKHDNDKANHNVDEAAHKALRHVLDSVHKAAKEIQPLLKEHQERDANMVAEGRSAIECPPYDAEALDKLQIPLKHLPRKKKTSVGQKYDRRAHNCASHGIWNRVTIKDHHDILHTMVKLGRVQRNSFIFDWGSGCGHSMQWLFEEYNVTGLGVDVSKLTIDYAIENTTKKNKYCVADGTKLDWIPSNIFDHAISFGSIYHVYNRTLFCHVIRQLVRIVRPVTGTVYNGWTENGEFKRQHWGPCLDDLPVHFEIIEEKEAFKEVNIFPLKSQQQVPNTYSLVVEKKNAIPHDEEPHKFSLENIPIACDDNVCVKKKDEKGMELLAKRAAENAKRRKGGPKDRSSHGEHQHPGHNHHERKKKEASTTEAASHGGGSGEEKKE